MAEYIDIVLKPQANSPDQLFVEIEDTKGNSIEIGGSFIDEQGFRRIRIIPEDIEKA